VGARYLTAYIADHGNSISYADSIAQKIHFPPEPQAITLTNPGFRSLASRNFFVYPTASSGLYVSGTSLTPSTCTLTEGSYQFPSFGVTPLQAGVCTLSAFQAGNEDFLPAPPVTISFPISDQSEDGFPQNSGDR
jgi:hypothetical protein